MKFFAQRDRNGHFEQVFAVYRDRAVKWQYDRTGWRPAKPSAELAKLVARDARLELLNQQERDRLFTLIDPPRNFSLDWQIRERWTGWVSVGLLLLPGIPLWFFWDKLVRWSSGYGETVAGVVIFSQLASLLLFREPLIERLVSLAGKTDALKAYSNTADDRNPAQEGLMNRLQDMSEERVRELAVMGAELAQMDAERNLMVRTQQLLQRQFEAPHDLPMSSQRRTTDVGGQWTVYVDDNFHYMDEGERYASGTFASYEAAVAACKKIVDDFLQVNSAETADQLFEAYVAFGEDPWISGPGRTTDEAMFSARSYARQRCNEKYE